MALTPVSRWTGSCSTTVRLTTPQAARRWWDGSDPTWCQTSWAWRCLSARSRPSRTTQRTKCSRSWSTRSRLARFVPRIRTGDTSSSICPRRRRKQEAAARRNAWRADLYLREILDEFWDLHRAFWNPVDFRLTQRQLFYFKHASDHFSILKHFI